ncbi:carboxypeptidase-like regulatory domain-containing protein [Flavobacterium sp.]|uniref:carboxypeptidase-like regulatory domain-containing protein n=1 Tax=Flavobacterium sp. TaxID=239 RepID=UPI004033DB81
MKNIISIITIAIFFLGFNAFAQNKVKPTTNVALITGTVTDEYGMSLPGANARILGTNSTYVQTDIDGQFSLSAKEGDKVEISYIGFRTEIYTVNKNIAYKIILREEFQDTGLVVYAKYSGRLRGVAAYYMFGY